MPKIVSGSWHHQLSRHWESKAPQCLFQLNHNMAVIWNHISALMEDTQEVTKISTSWVSYSSLYNPELIKKKSKSYCIEHQGNVSEFTTIKTLYDVYTVFTGFCREEHRPRVFKNRVLRWHLGPSIIQLIKSKTIRWVAHVACEGENRKACKAFAGKPER